MTRERLSGSQYERLAAEVEAFRLKPTGLLEHTQPVWMLGATWEMTLDGHEQKVAELTDEVSRLAGAAERGVAVAQFLLRTQTAEGAPVVVNPVTAWQSMLLPKPLLGRKEVLSACQASEGKLLALAREAREDESSLAGRVARVIRWPRRVRELAGFSADSRAGRVTQWSLSGLLFVVVGSVLSAGALAIVELLQRWLSGAN